MHIGVGHPPGFHQDFRMINQQGMTDQPGSCHKTRRTQEEVERLVKEQEDAQKEAAYALPNDDYKSAALRAGIFCSIFTYFACLMDVGGWL